MEVLFSGVSYLFRPTVREDTSCSMNRKPRKSDSKRLQLIDVRSAASLLGVSTWTVYHWARAGVVGSVTLGRRRLFEIATLEEFVRRGRRHGQLVAHPRKPDQVEAARPGRATSSEP